MALDPDRRYFQLVIPNDWIVKQHSDGAFTYIMIGQNLDDTGTRGKTVLIKGPGTIKEITLLDLIRRIR